VAEPLLAGLGGHGHSGDLAPLYFRIAALGLPARSSPSPARATSAASRTCAGRSRSSLPANVANLVLEVLFVYVFHWGIAGSAAGTAIAQGGMAARSSSSCSGRTLCRGAQAEAR
jgi:Na+-driven multidrug efflux pump